MNYGFIIAAGKQSRFFLEKPKALININGYSLLDLNIDNLNKCCDKVFVVCSFDNYKWFYNYNTIIINSGNGCGDAVLRALIKFNFKDDDKCIIQWGDCLHNVHLYDIIYKCKYNNCVYIPCKYEKDPYVQIVNYHNKINVLFSKYDDNITSGFHDLSIFISNANYLKKYLLDFANLYYIGNNKYKHKHNNELTFLDIFNNTEINGKILEVPKDYTYLTFNTLEELKKEVLNDKRISYAES